MREGGDGCGGFVKRRGKWCSAGEEEKKEEEAATEYIETLAKVASCVRPWSRGFAYMTVKQAHCTPICAIPRIPAAHSYPLSCLQHANACRLSDMFKMFANAQVPLVVPSSTK